MNIFMIFLKRIFRKTYYLSIYFFSFPVAFIFIGIFPFYKIRFLRLPSDRIGHYAMNTELLVCDLEENRQVRQKVFFYIHRSYIPLCNKQLHLMWKRVITIIPFPIFCYQVDMIMSKNLKKKYDIFRLKLYEDYGYGYQDINSFLKKKKPHLYFTDNEENLGKISLTKLGVADGSHFVCLLVRDDNYLKNHLPSNNWEYHNYRDCDIQKYKKMAIFLAEKGYYVIRMGKFVKEHFDVNHPLIIDYANHQLSSDFLDIYLSAKCRFFISTSSGLDAVPQVFRRPVVFTNVPPVSGLLQYWYPCEFFITKKIKDHNGNFLSFKQINNIFKKDLNAAKLLSDNFLEIVENSEEEILEIVSEMVDFIEKNFSKIENVFKENILKSLLPLSMLSKRDNDILFKNTGVFYSKIGKNFLLQNNYLVN